MNSDFKSFSFNLNSLASYVPATFVVDSNGTFFTAGISLNFLPFFFLSSLRISLGVLRYLFSASDVLADLQDCFTSTSIFFLMSIFRIPPSSDTPLYIILRVTEDCSFIFASNICSCIENPDSTQAFT